MTLQIGDKYGIRARPADREPGEVEAEVHPEEQFPEPRGVI
jgi:hypothetical protein